MDRFVVRYATPGWYGSYSLDVIEGIMPVVYTDVYGTTINVDSGVSAEFLWVGLA